MEIGTAFEIEQIQISAWDAAGGLFEAATETVICLPFTFIDTGIAMTSPPSRVTSIARSIPERSLPITWASPLTTACGV